jgi:translation initiation factor 5B
MTKIRQPIVTVVGHVDHGKTSILDSFRGSSFQECEAGGITQKISFTKYPLEQMKKACPLVEKEGVWLEIPGFLFIDTPGHAAFTSLRKRGGSLADLAILVVNIKDGIKPQTAEVLQILKAHKTPFVIALNKVDTISGWRVGESCKLKESIKGQAENVSQEFEEARLTFQGALQSQGFDSELYYEISDFSKQIAIVPCSAKTKEGIPELLYVLAGLSQRFLKEGLKIGNETKGVILEVKKEKNLDSIEAILYDGVLKEGDEIAIANFGDPILSKVRSIEEIQDLSYLFKNVKETRAASGLRLQLTNKEGVLAGMLFQKIDGNLDKIKEDFKKEISESVKCDRLGIIVRADSLGSLEALMTLLKQAGIKVLKAGIGSIGKTDVISAKANKEINELDSAIVGFNVEVEKDLIARDVKIITNPVVYKLIEDLQEWRISKKAEIERERLMGLANICKLEILEKYIFRNSNPAVFGVKVLGGKVKPGIYLIDGNGESLAKIKGIQDDKKNVQEAEEGKEVAISLPGVTFDRRLKGVKYLYSDLGEKGFRNFKKNKDLLTAGEKQVLQEIAEIKRRKNEEWGV